MKKINIQINQAKILNFSVELKEENPIVSAKIGLFAGQKQISTFSISTQDYYGDVKFDLPIQMICPILEIAEKLEEILTLKCSSSLGQLTKPKK